MKAYIIAIVWQDETGRISVTNWGMETPKEEKE